MVLDCVVGEDKRMTVSEKGEDFGATRVCACVGYASLLCLLQLVLWGGLPLGERMGFGVSDVLFWWSVPLCAAIGFSLLIVGFVAARASFRHRDRAVVPVGAAAHIVVVIAYMLLGLAPSASGIHVCALAVMAGVGLGLACATWADAFAWFDRDSSVKLVAISLMVAALAHLILNLAVPHFLAAAFCALAVIAACSLGLFFKVRKRNGGAGDQRGASPTQPSSGVAALAETIKAVRNPLYCAASIAFSVAITRMLALLLVPETSADVNTFGLAGVAIGSIVLLLANKRTGESLASSISIPSLFRVLFPIVATLLLALSLAGDMLALPVGATVFAIYFIVSALMLPICIDAAKERGVSPVSAFGLFAGLVYLVFAIATLLGIVLLGGNVVDSRVVVVCILVVLYILAMAFVLMERHARDSFSAEAQRGGDDIEWQGLADAVRASFEGSDSALKGGVQEGVASSDPIPSDGPDPIERRCMVLASQRGLSPRETDVLVAFAHGRNVAYLASQLVLSENTIRSHSKTLYTKLGVHSKQELIDLVESIQLESE